MSRRNSYSDLVQWAMKIRVKITRCIDVILEVYGCGELVEALGFLLDKCRDIGGRIYVHRIITVGKEPGDGGLLCSMDAKEAQPHMLQRCCPP